MEYGTSQTAPHCVGGFERILDEFGAHVLSDRPSDGVKSLLREPIRDLSFSSFSAPQIHNQAARIEPTVDDASYALRGIRRGSSTERHEGRFQKACQRWRFIRRLQAGNDPAPNALSLCITGLCFEVQMLELLVS